MIALYIALGVLALFLLVVFARALAFKPPKREVRSVDKIEIDENEVAYRLSEMIKCKTVSSMDKSLEDEGEFDKFKALLPTLFKNVFSACEYTEIGDRAILLRWRGKTEAEPTVLMAHYDVVSVEESDWEKPAFDGIIEDGVLWGRGVIDTKGTLNAALSAAERLIADGFVPEHDVYFAFAGDEEINGHGASDIVALFKEKNITPGIVVDEGGAVVDGVFPGVKIPCAVIGIAEKGMLNVEYSVTGGGGHSSAPKPHTPVGKLSAACVKLENSPFKFRLTAPTKQMFDTASRHSTFLYRVIFANLWCFAPILNMLGKKSGGQINAVARTTLAFTQMEGSKGINVIPPRATMASNSRILPGETTESALNYIKKKIDGMGVEVRMISGMNPSRISRTDCDAYKTLTLAVSDTWQEAIVSPYLMTACSDSRHWGVISDKVYRFTPFALSTEENARVHGNNERLEISKLARATEFYIRLIRSL